MAFSLSPAARVFTCGRIAVLQSKMGVFQTPKQFLPGVDRASARTTPALPAKSHAAPPLFACKRGRREFRASETRPSKSNASETWLVGSAVANNLFRLRARAWPFLYPQQHAFLPAGELRFCKAKWEFFKLPSNFSPELTERQRGQLLPSPQKVTLRLHCSLVNAVAASFAPAKLGRASRATRDLTRRLRLATNLFRKRARTLFLSGLQSLYKIPAGEAQRDFPALSGHRLKSRSVPQRREFPVPTSYPRLRSANSAKNRLGERGATRPPCFFSPPAYLPQKGRD